MTRLAVLVATAALVLASNALALGGSAYATISANWNTPGVVYVTVLSNHKFSGTLNLTCGTAINANQPLNNWTDDPIAHQNRIDTSFSTTAAGSGASCTLSVLDGHKVLAQQSFVTV
jgi:hypothetical protein